MTEERCIPVGPVTLICKTTGELLIRAENAKTRSHAHEILGEKGRVIF
jgi:hypothetical protein